MKNNNLNSFKVIDSINNKIANLNLDRDFTKSRKDENLKP
jgi:hypothetical protein